MEFALGDFLLNISADDVVVRFLRVRLGDEAGKLMDGIDVSNAENVMVDHCSVSWTPWMKGSILTMVRRTSLFNGVSFLSRSIIRRYGMVMALLLHWGV